MPWNQVNCFKLALKRPLRPGFCQIHCPDTYKLSNLFVLPLVGLLWLITSGADAKNKFNSSLAKPCWNKALSLAIPCHVLSFNQLECFISVQRSYAILNLLMALVPATFYCLFYCKWGRDPSRRLHNYGENILTLLFCVFLQWIRYFKQMRPSWSIPHSISKSV